MQAGEHKLPFTKLKTGKRFKTFQRRIIDDFKARRINFTQTVKHRHRIKEGVVGNIQLSVFEDIRKTASDGFEGVISVNTHIKPEVG